MLDFYPAILAAIISSSAASLPPVIDGVPITAIQQYDAYQFIPTITESKTDRVSFSIENKPTWAEFNTATGSLTGIVDVDESASDIVITATDNDTQITLKTFQFDISVAEAVNLAATYGQASQSETYGAYIASFAIDNNPNTYSHSYDVTAYEDDIDSTENYWQIELPSKTKITRVAILNKTLNQEMEGAEVYIRSTPYLYPLGESDKVATLTATDEEQLIEIPESLEGSYLIVKALNGAYVHIKEVKIYGHLDPSLYADISESVNDNSQYHRIGWDVDPSSTAIIGFTPTSDLHYYIRYGTSTDEASWDNALVTSKNNFFRSTSEVPITSYFVRLKNLTENSDVYYRVCTYEGCSENFWFKTAPKDDSPFIFIAGGDTRSSSSNRRAGNQIVAKTRPLFVMHGGDYTNGNTADEMRAYLDDWQLTFSDDSIEGKSYKRIYPILPTFGNHERTQYTTLCALYGIDPNQDGVCDYQDTYGVIEVSPLLRVYTLNSEYRNTHYAGDMNTLLNNDLAIKGHSAKWRIAQYHKPMFPHHKAKSEALILFEYWANDFYDYGMNLVVESDSHVAKITKIVQPFENDFITSNQGTVYVGEGSWAVLRAADDAKTWTQALGSMRQFKVITATVTHLEVRTARFGSGEALLYSDRHASSTVLPIGIDWWDANGIGTVLKLAQDDDGKTIMADENYIPVSQEIVDPNRIIVQADADTFVSSDRADENFNAFVDGYFDKDIAADMSKTGFGIIYALINFDIEAIPECNLITEATLRISISNPSGGTFFVHKLNQSWDENAATWNNNLNQEGVRLGSFVPNSTGYFDIDLDPTQMRDIEHGLVIIPNTTDGLVMGSKETMQPASLTLKFNTNACSEL